MSILKAFGIVLLLYVHAYTESKNTITAVLPEQSCSIAFVHLGPELPPYLGDAVFQARLFNTTNNIYVLAQQDALNSENAQKLREWLHNNLHVIIVPIETLPLSQEHKLFKETSTHNSRFRKGFWKFAVERFFVLDDFMQQTNLTHLIHLENDTLVYRSIDELLPIFRTYYHGIAAVCINDNKCIPCFVYIRDKTAIKKLTTYLAQQAYTGKNDMVLLAECKNKKAAHIDCLPIISRAYITKHGLKTANGEGCNNPEQYCNHIEDINSLFDGSALGLYLGGLDPRNGPSKQGFVSEDCLFNPSLVRCEWKKDECGRKIPFLTFNGESYQINNLHIHSKNLKAFLSVDISTK
jgi:hypothetical protein